MLQQRQRSQVRQNEVQQTNTNMTSIHCKLQEEAEKIRKWQTTSDIELKQKMAKLKECELLISKQRNQVLEMQIENENLTSALQKEQMNQVQINMKLKTSRELFIALKNHSENLQSTIIRGEEDRDSLRMLAADNIKQIKEMKASMQEIVHANDKRVSVLKACIKDNELVLEDVKFNTEKEIDNAKQTNNALENDLIKYRDDVDKVSRQLLEKRNVVVGLEEKIQKLENEIVKQQNEVTLSSATITELQSAIDETTTAHNDIQKEVVMLKQEQEQCADAFTAYKTNAENQIEELQSELTELTDSLTDLSTQYNEMTSKHDRLESENKTLRESVAQLVKCVEELQEKQDQNEQEMNNLDTMCKSSKEKEIELNRLLEEKEAGILELSSAKSELENRLKSVSEDFEKIKIKETEYLNEIERITTSDAKHKQLLDALDEKFNEKSANFDTHSKGLASDLDEQLNAYSKLEQKFKDYESQYKIISTNLNEKECQLEQLVSTNVDLKQQVADFVMKIQNLEDQHLNLNQNVLSLQKSFDECYKECESTKVNVKHLEEELVKKNSLVNRLKKDGTLTSSKYKDLLDEKKTMEQNLSEVQLQQKNIERDAKKKSSECENLKFENSQMGSAIKQLEKELHESRSIIESATNGSSVLNQKIATQLQDAKTCIGAKDEMIKKLNTDLSNLQCKNNSQQSESLKVALKEKSALEKEKKSLSAAVTNKDADISALAEEINKLQNKIQQLEEANQDASISVNDEVKSLQLKISHIDEEKANLSKKLSDLQQETVAAKLLKSDLELAQKNKDKRIVDLKSKNESLESTNKKMIFEMEEMNVKVDTLSKKKSNSENIIEKLKEKEKIKDKELKSCKSSVEEIKSDFFTVEEGYRATIEKLKDEIRQMNKDKVNAVLSNVNVSKSPAVCNTTSSQSSPISQRKSKLPESPKTPSANFSKRRRVAFGKSPSWNAPSSEDEEDTTVSSSTTSLTDSKVRYLSYSKSPKGQTYSSAKSPSKLKLSSKSPKTKPVSDLLATYPKPSTSQKRGIKLPDAYVKRKAENEKRKKKIKVESCSWFDSDSAFGFDEN